MNEVTHKVYSFGGGVQSMACLVLAAEGVINVDAFVFANVGERSENPATLRYIRDFALPYANKHGLRFEEVARGGDLYDYAGRPDLRSVAIPASRRAEGGKDGRAHRNCTVDWKIAVVDRWIKKTYPKQRVMVGLGISINEITRVRSTAPHDNYGSVNLGFTKSRWYPLIDLMISRIDCMEIIKDAGLPVPPKSSCYYCPFKPYAEWVQMRVETPELFEQAALLEDALNNKGLDGVYRLHGTRNWLPLREAIPTSFTLPMFSDSLEEGADCDEGVCFT